MLSDVWWALLVMLCVMLGMELGVVGVVCGGAFAFLS